MKTQDLTILLVEDDPNDVILIKRAFQKNGLINPIKVVSNGEEAIQYLEGKGPFSDRARYPIPILILLDLKMPKMSGFEFLKWVRAHPKYKKIIVVILTSSRESPDINRAYELGANSFLVKPVEFTDLIRLVKELHLYWILLNEPPKIFDTGD
ncbi:MAG: response regulator [Nitrospirae bacterium]|nr:response regulator [Nitrospirota bacterium]